MTRPGGPDVLAPRLVPEVHQDGFGSLLVAVSRAGGAVGFVPDSPEAEIRAAVAPVAEAVQAGREHMIVIGPQDAPAGTVFVRPGPTPRVAHRGDVVRLMVRPELQRRGLGRSLLDAAVAHATALGLEQLLLSARGGTHLPAYYAGLGWSEVGRWPGALRLGPGDDRDEHWFQLRLI